MVIYQINKAKYSCWKKCSTGQIVTRRFTANSDAIMCAVEVSGLSISAGTPLNDLCKEEEKIWFQRAERTIFCFKTHSFFIYILQKKRVSVLGRVHHVKLDWSVSR